MMMLDNIKDGRSYCETKRQAEEIEGMAERNFMKDLSLAEYSDRQTLFNNFHNSIYVIIKLQI